MTEQPTLDRLFEIASQYGNVHVFQSDKTRCFSAYIRFMTIERAQLEAKSGFGHPTARAALTAAIEKAQEIVASLQTAAASFDSIPRIGAHHG